MQLKRNKKKEFETLKKSHKKQIAIGAIAVCVIGGALTFATTRAKYRVTQDIPLVRGTANYKAYDFKIMAMYKQNDSGTYDEITDRMPGIGYAINESKSYCTPDNVNKDTSAVLKTIDGNHVISNLAKSDKCYLYFDKKVTNSVTLIATSKINTSTPIFSTNAQTDEGIFSAPDGMYGGTSYYWRGAATTNHLIFANKCWRIVRINGDESIRIIYNGPVKTGNTCAGNGENVENVVMVGLKYSSSDNNSSYVGWTYTKDSQRPADNAIGTASNAKTQTEAWYNSNIGNNASYAAKVADGKFCNDRTTQNNEAWRATGAAQNYAAYVRLSETFAPTLGCNTQDIYTLKVGAITADEAILAGGRQSWGNKSYYLCPGRYYYWTMTPHSWGGDYAMVYEVEENGTVKLGYVHNDTFHGLRPVINLRPNVTFSSGNGTSSSPYIVS